MEKCLYLKRRNLLLKKMKKNSAAIFFSAPIVYRNSDCNYLYRQDSDFWYLTGYSDPESAFIIIKYNNGCNNFIFFTRSQNKIITTWFGDRLSNDDIITYLGMNEVYPFSKINDYLLNILYRINFFYYAQGHFIYADKIIFSIFNLLRNDKQKKYALPSFQIDWRPLVHEMRLFKFNDEINYIKTAITISCKAHHVAMKICKANIYEYQIAAEIEYQFAIHGSNPAYTTIVASGKNACVLHYTKNSSITNNGDLILIDAGAEYKNYASDITRTFPVNGKFTKYQRDIYDIVLLASNTALSLYKPGITINDVMDVVIRIKTEGLVKLGILSGDINELIQNKAYLPFFMHSLSHWIGLDVHDVGDYGVNYNRILEPGMILSVEPGLYINTEDNIPDVYKGIGVRIEDTILITKNGNENLSANLIKDPDKIEIFMSNS